MPGLIRRIEEECPDVMNIFIGLSMFQLMKEVKTKEERDDVSKLSTVYWLLS